MELAGRDAAMWWRGLAVFGSSAISAAVFRPLTPIIYIGIYTYYILSIYKTDNRNSRKPALPRWKGSRFPLGSPADILPIALAEIAGKFAPSATDSLAIRLAILMFRVSQPIRDSRTMQNTIFSVDSAKAIKAQGYGYLNAIHYMAPASVAGVGDLCPKATAGCRAACLGWYSGQASMVAHDAAINSVRQSRIDKARRFMRDRAAYMRDVVRSIELAERKAARMGLRLCVRMNGSTDIAWEGIACERDGQRYRSLMAAFPHIQFVDYTKIASRMRRVLPANYHLTLSRNEENDATVADVVAAGGNAAVVFDRVPAEWRGMRVIDGDAHDLRHLDPRGTIVGLTPKGAKARRDTSGFVVRTAA